MKTLEGINNKLDEAKDWISKVEDKITEDTQSEQQNNNNNNTKTIIIILKNKESLRGLCNNICILQIPEREKQEQGIEKTFEEIMTENFPNLEKEKDTQV